MPQQENRNQEVVLAMVDALEQRDFAALEAHSGLYETRKYHPLWQSAFPDLTYRVEQMVADGDTVATRLTMSGTHRGPFAGVDPTRKEISVNVLMMDKVVDGEIVKHWANADWFAVFSHLGVIPPLTTA